MKQFFIIFAFVAMLIPAWGQRAEGSADSLKLHDIALQRAKAEKGGSFVFANMWECPLTLSNDYMEITNGNLNVGYGYFFADRFALTACYSAKNFADGFSAATASPLTCSRSRGSPSACAATSSVAPGSMPRSASASAMSTAFRAACPA